MKFTEGYWLLSERTNGQFASQAYHIEAMENGLRVMAKHHHHRRRSSYRWQPLKSVDLLQ